MDPFTPHSTSDDWMAMDDSANNELDEELRALINFSMPEAARDHNASDELDEELRSLIDHNFDSPRAAHQHIAMHSGRQTFGSDATMQMNSENHQMASPGYTAIAREFDNQNPYQRTRSDSTAGNANMQKQINELRQMVSTLVRDKRQRTERRHLNEAAQLFGSSSFHQIENERSRPTSSVSTAVDETPLPVNHEEDSQGLSRRSSSTKRKSRIRIPGGYQCVKCDAKFDIPSLLRQHELTHLSYDERPHACSHCGQRFVYPKDVTRHERQVHDLHRTSQDEPLEEDQTSAIDAQRYGPTRADNVQASEGHRGKKPPRRNNSAAARARERHARSLRQSGHSFEQENIPSTRMNSQASSFGRRRASEVADIITGDTGESQHDHVLPDANPNQEDLINVFRSLQIQTSAQRKTISDLQHDLTESKKIEDYWRIERDRFAAMLAELDAAEAEQQTSNLLEQQLQQSVEPHRLQRNQNNDDFDEFIIYTAKFPRQQDQATEVSNA